MKTTQFITACLVVVATSRCMASTATVNLDNFSPQDANGIPLNPIYACTSGKTLWVEVLGNGSPLSPPIQAQGFDLNRDGGIESYLFQGGTGEFPPSVAGGSAVTLLVRVWYGAATYEQASVRGLSAPWTQNSGSWDKTARPLPTPPDVPLLMPGPLLTTLSWYPCP